MNMKKLAGICILIPILLAGCGNQSDKPTAAASTAQSGQQTEKAAGNGQQNNQQNRPAMDPAQRQLFSTFQTLMMLDKADGLTITKEQAQAMLPVAEDIIAKKELSDDNKTKLLANLTDAQKAFLTDAESRMGNRGNGGNGGPNGQGNAGQNGQRPNRNGGSGDAGKAQSPDASASPTASGQPSGSPKPNNGAGGGQNGGFGGGNRPAGGQMGDVGKQFVELLQNKVK
ncbi:hypothetical protein [Paenibacillus qinlingensis]|uniref:Lipoprotein n=1 Tax=Paenibacillus qinlingensis TaxID=1837343 RepID=A0ABU1NYX3_9BACL|nr:hypothetical protein [Paenibacillus qinlingensis]MDR6552037.1 hypothetical protein [Paenibacillus qinlingensis]